MESKDGRRHFLRQGLGWTVSEVPLSCKTLRLFLIGRREDKLHLPIFSSGFREPQSSTWFQPSKVYVTMVNMHTDPRWVGTRLMNEIPNKGLFSQSYGFSSSHVWIWELDHKEGWAPKNWRCWTVVLEKTLLSPLDCKEIKPVNPKGNQSWIFIGRIDDEAPTLWPLDAKTWLIRSDPDAGKDWRQEEKGTTEDEMVGCHYRLNGHEFEQTPGDGEGWRSLAHCSPWGRKDSDMTEQLSLHFTLHIKPVEEYLAFTMLTDYYYSFISRSHPTIYSINIGTFVR